MASLNVWAASYPRTSRHIVMCLSILVTSHAALHSQLAAEPPDDTAARTLQSRSVEPSQDNASLDARVSELIEGLGDPSYQRREAAEWALHELGLAAFEQLRKAAIEHPDIQVAKTAAYIIQSQDVVWYLETDSVDVRGFLTDYDSLSERSRIDRVKSLAQHGSPDAILALCRLARFERHENVSKEAALGLIAFLSEADQVAAELLESIAQSMGESDRPAVQWIRQAVSDLSNPAGADLAAWKKLVDLELSAPRTDHRGQGNRLVFDFFARCGVWLKLRLGSEAAMEVVESSVDLLRANPSQLKEYAEQVLDEWQLPELVVELSKRYRELFDKEYELGYFLAEAHQRLGHADQAEQTAKSASDQIASPPVAARKLSRAHDIRTVELDAHNRRSQAIRLNQRGLFDWAEREYRRALELSAERLDTRIRLEFAEFYWLGSQNAKAAALLKDSVERLEADEQADLKKALEQSKRTPQSIQQLFRETDNRKLRGGYYFYNGLAEIDSGDMQAASISLTKALEEQPDNPDILIALRQTIQSEESRQFYEEAFTNMRGRFRRLVVRAEEGLARAQDREQRRRLEYDLAQSCNQLAWLLGKCESDPEEAVQLSERSLEIMPGEPAFLDTLGRCYFSAGRIDDAIRVQREAIELAPYERLMLAQLQEFERSKDSPTD